MSKSFTPSCFPALSSLLFGLFSLLACVSFAGSFQAAPFNRHDWQSNAADARHVRPVSLRASKQEALQAAKPPLSAVPTTLNAVSPGREGKKPRASRHRRRRGRGAAVRSAEISASPSAAAQQPSPINVTSTWTGHGRATSPPPRQQDRPPALPDLNAPPIRPLATKGVRLPATKAPGQGRSPAAVHLPVFARRSASEAASEAEESSPEPDEVDVSFLLRLAAAVEGGSTSSTRASSSGAGNEASADAAILGIGRTGSRQSQPQWNEAVTVLRAMCARTDRAPRGSPPPRRAFDLVLQACAAAGRWDATLEALSLMAASGVTPRTSTYKAIVRAIAARSGSAGGRGGRPGGGGGGNCGRVAAAGQRSEFVVQMLTAMRSAGVSPDLEMLELAAAACTANGNGRAAAHFLRQADALGFAASPALFRSAAIGIADSGRWQPALELLREMRQATGAPPGPAAARAVVCAAMAAAPVGPGSPAPTAAGRNGNGGRNGAGGGWRAAVTAIEELVKLAAGAMAPAAATARAVAAGAIECPGAAGEAAVTSDVGSNGSAGPDQATFLLAIGACARAGEADAAVVLLRLMPAARLLPCVAAFNGALAACERSRRWQLAMQLLDEAAETGAVDVVGFNTVISALGKSGQWAKAMALLPVMRDRGVTPDRYSYNSAISACAAVSRSVDGAWRHALALLDEMRRRGVAADLFSFTAAINACARARRSDDALRVLSAMRSAGIVLDTVAYTAVIDALAHAGRWRESLELLDEMRAAGLVPNERTYRAAIEACSRGGQWERGLELLETLRATGATVGVITTNAAMTACVKGHENKRALNLLARMKAEGLEPDMVSYTAAISACGAAGDWRAALALLAEMKALAQAPEDGSVAAGADAGAGRGAQRGQGGRGGGGVRPNVIVYTAAITAAGRAGRWKESLRLLDEMKEEGLVPDRVTYNACITALRRGGQLPVALELFERYGGDEVSATDLVTALTDEGRHADAAAVYATALRRGCLPAASRLDGRWEADLSGMPPAMARAKARCVLDAVAAAVRTAAARTGAAGCDAAGDGAGAAGITAASCGGDVRVSDDALTAMVAMAATGTAAGAAEGTSWALPHVPEDLTFVTGAGEVRSVHGPARRFNLRLYMQDVLQRDYMPSLEVSVPERLRGCLIVPRRALATWVEAQPAAAGPAGGGVGGGGYGGGRSNGSEGG